MRLSDRVVVINEGLRVPVTSRGVLAENVTVVPNAVSRSVLECGLEQPAPSAFNRFAYVGNFSSIEGLDLLVEAFLLAFPPDQYPNHRLSFYGRGVWNEELDNLLRDSSDSRIRNYGQFEHSEIASVYQDNDCIVNPRISSELTTAVTPLKPLEAMAFSRLVITSDIKAMREVTGGERRARFFKAGDVHSLVETLKHVSSDLPGSKSTARSGRQYVETERTWAANAHVYESLYKELLSSDR